MQKRLMNNTGVLASSDRIDQLSIAARSGLGRNEAVMWARVTEAVYILVAVQRIGFGSGKRCRIRSVSKS